MYILYFFFRVGEYYVTRSCYNATAGDIPKGCEELFHGETCYCVPKEGEKTCNGQSRVVPLYLHYIGLFAVLCLAYIKF